MSEGVDLALSIEEAKRLFVTLIGVGEGNFDREMESVFAKLKKELYDRLSIVEMEALLDRTDTRRTS
jgi:hypothetical protein